MPIYEYRCTGCGGRYEVLVPSAEPATPRCPRCGDPRAERLISAFAVGRSPRAPAPGPCGATDCACRND